MKHYRDFIAGPDLPTLLANSSLRKRLVVNIEGWPMRQL